MQIPNVEVYKRKYPVTIVRQEFRTDAAGAGEFRGGTGVDYEVHIHAPFDCSFRGEGLHTPSGFGICEGTTGSKAEPEVTLEDGPLYEAPQYGVRSLPPARIGVASAGGGGWDGPLRRDPARVLRDVVDGLVSEEQARLTYGVVLAPGLRSVDAPTTSELRRARMPRHDGAFHGWEG